MNEEMEPAPFSEDSRIYLTVHYACGHIGLRGVLRLRATDRQLQGKDREIISGDDCSHCSSITAAKQGAGGYR